LNRDHVAVAASARPSNPIRVVSGGCFNSSHRPRGEVDPKQAIGMVGNHGRIRTHEHDDALERHELDALTPGFEVVRPRCQTPYHRAATVRDQDTAIRPERQVAEDM